MSSAAAAADKRAGPAWPADPGRGEAMIRTHFVAQLNEKLEHLAGGDLLQPRVVESGEMMEDACSSIP